MFRQICHHCVKNDTTIVFFIYLPIYMVVGAQSHSFGVVSAAAHTQNKDLNIYRKKQNLSVETVKHLASLVLCSTEFPRLIMGCVKNIAFH